MGYILGLVVVALLFLALHYFTDLDKKQKLIISAFLLSVVVGAVTYNNYTYEQRDKMLNVVVKFNQGKTVRCQKTLDVNQSNYTLSIGTYTFIGKPNTPHYAQMISVSQCE